MKLSSLQITFFSLMIAVGAHCAPLPRSLFFVANEGQWEEPFAFKANVGNVVYYVTPTGMTMDYRQYERPQQARDPMDRFEMRHEPEPMNVRGHVLKMNFVNANPSPEIIGEEKLSSYSNYFIGRDSCKWRSFVGHYQRVRVKNVWNGIDVEYGIQPEGIETIYRVQAGANASQIMVQYEGLTMPLRIDGAGNLILSTSLGEVKEKAPFAYQIVNHRQVEVPVQYHVLANDKYSLSFEAFDAGQELVIDPLVYCTFFAGSWQDDVSDVTKDSLGNVIVGGHTLRSTFPTTPGAYRETMSGGGGYVSKISARGDSLIFSTFISSGSGGYVLADPTGRIYYTCGANRDFPLTPDAFDTVADEYETGLIRLSADGSQLEFGSYLGGTGEDVVDVSGMDSVGRIYLTGWTESPDYPITPNALFHFYMGSFQSVISIFDPATSRLVYSTFLTDATVPNGMRNIAVISPGILWVCATSEWGGMHVTPNALLTTPAPYWPSYFALLDLNRDSILYGSYFGWSQTFLDEIRCIVVEDTQRIILFGDAAASNFPMPAGGFDSQPPVRTAMFGLELELPSTLVRGTFIDGPGLDWVADVVQTGLGDFVLCGSTDEEGFPTTPDAYSRHYSGGYEADYVGDLVICELSRDFTTLRYSTYVGGSDRDYSNACVHAGHDVVWVGGTVSSSDFPTTPDALFNQPSSGCLVRLDLSGQSVPNTGHAQIPDRFSLSCFPNPFNPTTTISFSLPQSSPVQFEVFDILGRTVHHDDLGRLNAGTYQRLFDGSSMGSGVYFARLMTKKQIQTTKLLLLR